MTDHDRNLRVAVIALRDRIIDESQFVDICKSWLDHPEQNLDSLLVARGWVEPAVVESLLRRLDGSSREPIAGLEAVDSYSTVADPGLTGPVEPSAVESTLATVPPGQTPITLAAGAVPTLQRSRFIWDNVHAEGGLGRVWIARDVDLNRVVALKEIKPKHADEPDARARFLKEAQITGQLEHPNIVPVYELARRDLDGRPFYAMQFVRGETLRRAIADFHEERRAGKTDPLVRHKLLQSFVTVCQAVGYAHSRGVVHRDLKPDNVLLGDFGEVLLLDWGLAGLLDQPEAPVSSNVTLTDEANLEVTLAGARLGTPAYMAPEQAEGRLEAIDERTDIHGLGAILFEILTGRPPHHGRTSAEAIRAILDAKESPRASARGVPVPPALDAICARAMERAPEARYQRAADLAEDVQRWLADEPVSVFPEWYGRRWWRWGKSHPWVVRSVGIATAALITVFLLTFALVASVALLWVPLGGIIGTLVGIFQGKARQGARQGALFGFRVGLALGVLTFLAAALFEIIQALVLGRAAWPFGRG